MMVKDEKTCSQRYLLLLNSLVGGDFTAAKNKKNNLNTSADSRGWHLQLVRIYK